MCEICVSILTKALVLPTPAQQRWLCPCSSTLLIAMPLDADSAAQSHSSHGSTELTFVSHSDAGGAEVNNGMERKEKICIRAGANARDETMLRSRFALLPKYTLGDHPPARSYQGLPRFSSMHRVVKHQLCRRSIMNIRGRDFQHPP